MYIFPPKTHQDWHLIYFDSHTVSAGLKYSKTSWNIFDDFLVEQIFVCPFVVNGSFAENVHTERYLFYSFVCYDIL